MQLDKVILSNFRSYAQKEITFSPHLNCVFGDNAVGKSNLLEAIYLLSTGKSFRTHYLHDLVRHSEKNFRIEAKFSKDGSSDSLVLVYGTDGRKMLYNNTAHASFLPLLGLLPCVLLTPEDISILTGAPAQRRRFLDLHLSQMDPLYIHHLGRYHKAMKQRNALLKQKEAKGLDPWEQIMAASASYLIEKRQETLLVLQPFVEETISELSETRERFSWVYENSLGSSDPLHILEQWKKSRGKELLLGSTLSGPHRDDILFYLQEQEIKTYCSEGQKRSCIAALRLAEWQRLYAFLGTAPLFGIDDFGAHLDAKRTTILQKMTRNLGQVFLTAPSFSPVEEVQFSMTSLP
ncbi:MAG: DNA replication and repair protein RecF [Rhabdochlamydiaceae bacterium]|nr:DNA replication and repair protein RecF [Rhabdochlamydiaceae bacterium]